MSKAATRGEKLRRRRGRPLLPANDREPNGKPSRRTASIEERERYLEHLNMAVALQARSTKLGIVPAVARDPRWGYLLGRMFMDGNVTESQHEAGVRYAQDMARYYGLSGFPFPSARSAFLFPVKPSEERVDKDSLRTSAPTPESKAEAAKAATERMTELRTLLLAAGDINTGRRVLHTVNVVCVEDIDELRTLNEAMKAWLKRGLNALARHYGC